MSDEEADASRWRPQSEQAESLAKRVLESQGNVLRLKLIPHDHTYVEPSKGTRAKDFTRENLSLQNAFLSRQAGRLLSNHIRGTLLHYGRPCESVALTFTSTNQRGPPWRVSGIIKPLASATFIVQHLEGYPFSVSSDFKENDEMLRAQPVWFRSINATLDSNYRKPKDAIVFSYHFKTKFVDEDEVLIELQHQIESGNFKIDAVEEEEQDGETALAVKHPFHHQFHYQITDDDSTDTLASLQLKSVSFTASASDIRSALGEPFHPRELMPSWLKLPTFALSDKIWTPQYECPVLQIPEQCPKGCGCTHIQIKPATDSKSTIEWKQSQLDLWNKGIEIPREFCTKNTSKMPIKEICPVVGCNAQPAASDQKTIRQWRIDHVCDLNCAESPYQKLPLRPLPEALEEANKKQREKQQIQVRGATSETEKRTAAIDEMHKQIKAKMEAKKAATQESNATDATPQKDKSAGQKRKMVVKPRLNYN